LLICNVEKPRKVIELNSITQHLRARSWMCEKSFWHNYLFLTKKDYTTAAVIWSTFCFNTLCFAVIFYIFSVIWLTSFNRFRWPVTIEFGFVLLRQGCKNQLPVRHIIVARRMLKKQFLICTCMGLLIAFYSHVTEALGRESSSFLFTFAHILYLSYIKKTSVLRKLDYF
jgi:hypothetical protein